MLEEISAPETYIFLVNLVLCLVFGIVIGVERESRGKAAGISTHSFVIGGAMMFTYYSLIIEPSAPGRVAAQIITGVGFLGAGIILKSKHGEITNLTTAASLWFAAAIGMAVALGYYFAAVIATIYSLITPRIPHIKSEHNQYVAENKKSEAKKAKK